MSNWRIIKASAQGALIATGMPVGQSLDHCTGMPVTGLPLCGHMLPAAGIKVCSLLQFLLY